MRIVHALQLPLLQQGGVEVLVRTLIDESMGRDEIFLISEDSPEDLEKSGWSSRLAGHLQVPSGLLPRDWGDELLSWVSKQRIDLCHFHMTGTYAWRAWSWRSCPITRLANAGVPVVSTNHQAVTFFDPSRPPSPTWRKWAGTLRFWPGKARQLNAVRWEASVSRHDLEVTRHWFPGFQNKTIQLYHSRLDQATPVQPPRDSKLILNVATVAFRKGQHHLVEAFSKIAADYPGWRLRIVGTLAETACIERIQETITRHHIEDRIELTGPDPEPSRHFEECEIYVQPSLLEGLGLSLQEAMFHGRACVGARSGGIPELINEPSVGLLYERDRVDELADCLARLIADDDLRTSMGTAARTSILARGMTRQAMAENYRSLYQQQLAR